MATIIDTDRERDALIERLMQSSAGVFDIFTTYLGNRPGVVSSAGDYGPCTSAELADRTGPTSATLREWLEQQTVIGTLLR